MTEQEAIELLQNLNVKLTDMAGHKTNGIEKIFGWNEITAICEAINALEEVEQYREIGTPKEIKQRLEELERWHTYRLAINVKNPFAKMSTSICHNCDHKDEYIEELEAEIKEYKAIGDFAELVEKWCWKHQYYNQDDLNELMEIAEQLKGGGVAE